MLIAVFIMLPFMLPAQSGSRKTGKAGVVQSEKKKKAVRQKAGDAGWTWQFLGGGDLSFGFPVGHLRDTVNNGTGFTLSGEYVYLPQLHLGLSTGFKSYKYDKVIVGKGHLTYIPVKLTATWYFMEDDFRPYAKLGLGAFLVKYKYDAEFWTWVRNPQTNHLDTLYEVKHMDKGQTCFGLTPAIGVLYRVKDRYYANVALSHDLVFTEGKPSNFIGLNFGLIYRFGF